MIRKIFSLMLFIYCGFPLQAQKAADVITEKSELKEVVVVRLKPGTDMLEGLKKAIGEKGIKNGIILNGIGSVSKYHFHVVSDDNLPPAEAFVRESMPMDVISVQGYIFEGRVHAHVCFSDELRAIGGHLEPGTAALTFLIITIGVLPESADISNFDNYSF